ncbi:MAG: hypothetical protein RXO36_05160, partial [Candidatus Nanopusillus acidilobi]
MKKVITSLLLATTPLYAEPQWVLPPASFRVKLHTLPSCWISQYCQKSQPILNQIENQLVKDNNTETTQKTRQDKTKRKTNQQANQQPQNHQAIPSALPTQSQPIPSTTNSSASSNTQQTTYSNNNHKSATIYKSATINKLFTNTVFLSVPSTHSSWYNN